MVAQQHFQVVFLFGINVDTHLILQIYTLQNPFCLFYFVVVAAVGRYSCL